METTKKKIIMKIICYHAEKKLLTRIDTFQIDNTDNIRNIHTIK